MSNKLLSSFLFNRKQYGSYEIFPSRTENILYGVLQGSNLGPLLFLVYINDLLDILNCDAKLIADDSCLVEKADNALQLELKLNQNLRLIYEWTTANLITVNPHKSLILIIPPKQNVQTPKLNIHLGSSALTIQDSVKYLGIHIDRNLNFLEHIRFLEAKISKYVGIMMKLKMVLPRKHWPVYIIH